MDARAKPGRNEPCSCGSGKKYKNCHGKIEAEQKGRWSTYGMLLIGIALVIGGGELLVSLFTNEAPTDGRVWSAEHGHWHDASGRELGAGAGSAAPAAPRPQPPGPVPPGKVWSAEHGHWHDA